MVDLAKNIQQVRERIDAAARRRGITGEDITLVGVTKTVPATIINQAIQAGLGHIGENRIQEAREKLAEVQSPVVKHMIGNLQRNKVKYAVKLFDMIQSVNSIILAEEINAKCSKDGVIMPVLIEVNTSGEPSKVGCQPGEALTLLQAIDRLPSLSVKGFMTIAIFDPDPDKVRPCFRQLKEIFDRAREIPLHRADLSVLSMGMSHDFETAIEEGATMVRIGTAIFGERDKPEGE